MVYKDTEYKRSSCAGTVPVIAVNHARRSPGVSVYAFASASDAKCLPGVDPPTDMGYSRGNCGIHAVYEACLVK